MEPIESDFQYAAPRSSANLRGRFNWLLILPTLGLIWLVFLALSAAFQWTITDVVNPVMSIMIVLFFVMVGLLFWAMAPKENRE